MDGSAGPSDDGHLNAHQLGLWTAVNSTAKRREGARGTGMFVRRD